MKPYKAEFRINRIRHNIRALFIDISISKLFETSFIILHYPRINWIVTNTSKCNEPNISELLEPGVGGYSVIGFATSVASLVSSDGFSCEVFSISTVSTLTRVICSEKRLLVWIRNSSFLSDLIISSNLNYFSRSKNLSRIP